MHERRVSTAAPTANYGLATSPVPQAQPCLVIDLVGIQPAHLLGEAFAGLAALQRDQLAGLGERQPRPAYRASGRATARMAARLR